MSTFRLSSRAALAAALLAAHGCAFAPPPSVTPSGSATTGPDGRSVVNDGGSLPGAVAGSGAAAPAVTYGPLGPVSPPDVGVTAFTLKTQPVAGGATWQDLDKDEDAYDDFKPAVPAILTTDGYGAGLTAANVEVTIRGKSTRQARQKSYRLHILKDQPAWQGQDDIQLNKHPYDNTRMRNKLAFDLFRSLPEMTAADLRFASLAVDGTDFGLFSRVERLDKRFLAKHGLDREGYFYKAEQFEFGRNADHLRLKTDPSYDKAAFERLLQIQGNTDHAPLLAMLDDINDESKDFNTTFDKHMDRANYLTWLATNVLLDNLDTNSQNFYLYAPAGAGKWRFVPWDYDGALGMYDENPAGRAAFLSPWQQGPANWWAVVLHRRFLKAPGNLEQLIARINELHTSFYTRDRISQLVDAYKPIVGPHVAKAPDNAGLRPGDWATAVAALPGQVDLAHQRFMDALERPMPVFLSEPALREGQTRFAWDPSHDLQGDALSYDFKITRDPGLSEVVKEAKGLTTFETSHQLSPGAYYYTVTIRDAKGNSQVPFDTHTDDAGKRWPGAKAFSVK